jgi:DNA-binding NarL/FixJ family response regulator
MPIRIILADDHAIVLNGLKRLFESDADFTVLECCRDGTQALSAVKTHAPDVLVLDMRMPGRTGLEVLQELGETAGRCRTVLLTAAITDDEVLRAVQLGAQVPILPQIQKDTIPVREAEEGSLGEEVLRRAGHDRFALRGMAMRGCSPRIAAGTVLRAEQ